MDNTIGTQNFSRWNEALLTKDPKEVAKLYIEDATFLPTLSPEFKKGKQGAEEYFIHFLEKDPIGTIIEEEIQIFGDTRYLHSGMYNFEVGPVNDRTMVEARFSMVWEKDDVGEWKISHHHSSMKP